MAQVVFDLDNIPGADLSVQRAHRGSPDTMIQQYPVVYNQSDAAAVADATSILYTSRGAGTIERLTVTPKVAPLTTASYTVDVQVGNELTGYVTILNAVITADSTTADKEVLLGSLDVTAYSANDNFIIIVDETTAGGTQGTGLNMTLWLREQPS